MALWLNAQDHLKEKELVAAIDALRPPLKKCTEAVTELRDGIIRRTR